MKFKKNLFYFYFIFLYLSFIGGGNRSTRSKTTQESCNGLGIRYLKKKMKDLILPIQNDILNTKFTQQT